MNWTIIYRDNYSKEVDIAVDLLRKNKITPVIFNFSDFQKMSVDLMLEKLKDFTHAIILDSELLANDNSPFIYGYLYGSKANVYSLKNKWVLNSSESCSVKSYGHLDDLVKDIKDNFKEIKKEDIRSRAWAALFHDGIPFTGDCFASHIARDNRSVCDLFIAAGMSVNQRDGLGTPMLNIAVRNEQVECVNWLFKYNVDIDAVSEDRGYSAVMDAVWKGNTELTELLVKKGANLNFVSRDNQTALVLAVGEGKANLCKLLVENGADPDIKDAMGMSAYGYAKLFKHNDIVEILEKFHKE